MAFRDETGTVTYDLSRIRENPFSYKDVMRAFQISDYQDLKRILDSFEEAGLVSAVKKSGKTSFTPSVWEKYKKLRQTPDYSEAKREIQGLCPELNLEGYLKNPEKYLECREEIQKLSDFLWKRKKLLSERISVKERSFQIFGEEKFLEKKGSRVLAFNHISEEDLNYYLVHEPFFHLPVQGREQGGWGKGRGDQDPGEAGVRDTDGKQMAEAAAALPVLVCENKDPWYSISLALNESSTGKLFGIRLSHVIYGEGNKITRKQALTDFLPMIGSKAEKVYYIGDIDGQGIRMLYSIIEGNNAPVCPFLPLYREMLKTADLSSLHESDDQRGREWPEEFFSLFSAKEAEKLREVQRRNLLIPQEILNRGDYRQMCG